MRYRQELSRTSHPGDFGRLHMSSTRHTALTLNHPDEISRRAKSSGWFTENFVMSSVWIRVASYVIRMRYHLALSDPDDLLHCQWFKWLTHMLLKLPRILAFRITGPLWGDPPIMLLFAVCLVVILNTLLNKQSSYRWFQTPCRSNVVNLCLGNRTE